MQAFDASAIVYAWDNYPVRQFPPLWEWMAAQIEEKKLVMPKVAFQEVMDKTPDCGEWLQNSGIEQLEISNAILRDSPAH